MPGSHAATAGTTISRLGISPKSAVKDRRWLKDNVKYITVGCAWHFTGKTTPPMTFPAVRPKKLRCKFHCPESCDMVNASIRILTCISRNVSPACGEPDFDQKVRRTHSKLPITTIAQNQHTPSASGELRLEDSARLVCARPKTLSLPSLSLWEI